MTDRVRIFGALALAGLLFGGVTPAAAQEVSLDEARETAARELVLETYAGSDAFTERALEGKVFPYCGVMQYPYPLTGDESEDLPPLAERRAIALAIDVAFVEQALLAAGYGADNARTLAASYRANRTGFDALADAERAELIAAEQDPSHRLVAQSLELPRVPGAVELQAPARCMAANEFDPAAQAASRGPTRGATRGASVSDVASSYRFVTVPADASVYIIPRFSFAVCQKRFADPYSRQQCTAWRKVLSGSTQRLSGQYEYSVEWPDGAKERERAVFEPAGGAVQEIRFTKPRR
jgi:hypothetical protein